MSSTEVIEKLIELTREESFVLYYKLYGKSHKDIGIMMGISADRVQQYSSAVFKKFSIPGGDMGLLRKTAYVAMVRISKVLYWHDWHWPTQELVDEFTEIIKTKEQKNEPPIQEIDEAALKKEIPGEPTEQEVVKADEDSSPKPIKQNERSEQTAGESPAQDDIEKVTQTRPWSTEWTVIPDWQDRIRRIAGTPRGQIFGIVTVVMLCLIGYFVVIYEPKLISTPTPLAELVTSKTITIETPTPTKTKTRFPTTTPTSTSTPSPSLTNTHTPSHLSPPTSSVTPSPANNILFFDNFDEDLSDEWTLVGGNYGTDGGLFAIGSFAVVLKVGSPDWTNYKVEFDVTKIGDGRIGVEVREDDTTGSSGNGYKALINSNFYRNGYSVDWWIIKDGRGVKRSYWPFELNKASHIDVVAQNDRFSVLVDGVEIGELKNSDNPKGFVFLELGLGYEIDNFTVTSLP